MMFASKSMSCQRKPERLTRPQARIDTEPDERRPLYAPLLRLSHELFDLVERQHALQPFVGDFSRLRRATFCTGLAASNPWSTASAKTPDRTLTAPRIVQPLSGLPFRLSRFRRSAMNAATSCCVIFEIGLRKCRLGLISFSRCH